MTGIEKLRDVCRALKGSPWCGTDIATIGGEPAYEKLRKIADQIERETLPRPRFEDGTVVEIGDAVGGMRGDGIVTCYDVGPSGYWTIYDDIGQIEGGAGKRVKRPEPPDTWEKLTAEVEACNGSACRYFKKEYNPESHTCYGCKAHEADGECTMIVMQDVLRRAKKLAGVE